MENARSEAFAISCGVDTVPPIQVSGLMSPSAEHGIGLCLPTPADSVQLTPDAVGTAGFPAATGRPGRGGGAWDLHSLPLLSNCQVYRTIAHEALNGT